MNPSAAVCAQEPWPGTGLPARREESQDVDHGRALERFLADAERRAFRIARMATGSDDDALDLVQDAMLGLARHYGHRPQEEWRPLFHRILTNGIRDFSRRRRVRQRLFAWWPARGADEDGPPEPEAVDPAAGPVQQLEDAEAMAALEAALAALPERQREAFVLRTLEGLDVAATAVAMGCSEGSVKTHHFRAMHALRERLGEWQ